MQSNTYLLQQWYEETCAKNPTYPPGMTQLLFPHYYVSPAHIATYGTTILGSSYNEANKWMLHKISRGSADSTGIA